MYQSLNIIEQIQLDLESTPILEFIDYQSVKVVADEWDLDGNKRSIVASSKFWSMFWDGFGKSNFTQYINTIVSRT